MNYPIGTRVIRKAYENDWIAAGTKGIVIKGDEGCVTVRWERCKSFNKPDVSGYIELYVHKILKRVGPKNQPGDRCA